MWEDFYLANQKGSDTKGIRTQEMQAMAQRSQPLELAELERIIEEHTEFLRTGGGGGKWQVFTVSGVAFGMYQCESEPYGKQAQLDMRLFPKNLQLAEIQLPFSSWCGCYAKAQDLSDANLEGSIFCDAMLENTLFVDANLASVDFSRATLRNASFMNANLTNADFENCDLTGADFRGAILTGAKFAGARLYEVKR